MQRPIVKLTDRPISLCWSDGLPESPSDSHMKHCLVRAVRGRELEWTTLIRDTRGDGSDRCVLGPFVSPDAERRSIGVLVIVPRCQISRASGSVFQPRQRCPSTQDPRWCWA
jgi:hypothetical protein